MLGWNIFRVSMKFMSLRVSIPPPTALLGCSKSGVSTLEVDSVGVTWCESKLLYYPVGSIFLELKF